MLDMLTPHLPTLVLAYGAFLIASASPGPTVFAIMATAMGRGRRPAVALALGAITGSTIWGISAALGVAALLATMAAALTVLKIVGGLYLLWLAGKALRSALRPNMPAPPGPGAGADRAEPFGRDYRRGLALHLTNPKAILAWIAIVALGIGPGAPGWLALPVVGGCVALAVCVNLGYALAFSTPPLRRAWARARRWIEVALAATFGLAGLRLLTARLPIGP